MRWYRTKLLSHESMYMRRQVEISLPFIDFAPDRVTPMNSYFIILASCYQARNTLLHMLSLLFLVKEGKIGIHWVTSCFCTDDLKGFCAGVKDKYIITLDGNEFLDATRKGSLARFINHSWYYNHHLIHKYSS